jgi:hypothetical protein
VDRHGLIRAEEDTMAGETRKNEWDATHGSLHSMDVPQNLRKS